MCVWLAFQRDFLFYYITIACMDQMIYQGLFIYNFKNMYILFLYNFKNMYIYSFYIQF